MYAFLVGMWARRKVTETQIRSYVPKFISAEEAEGILTTAQNEA
ncbi:hypothetical protein [Bacillus sp. ISL-57]|nr:hypothetical protein [Bacillus sp. ISL-57]